MALPKTLRNFIAFIDGFGWAGVIEEGMPPKLALVTEEYEGGGMAGPVDLDMGSVAKLEGELTFAEYNPSILGHFGKVDLPITLRGAQTADGTTESVIWQMRALIRELDPGTLKRGDGARLKLAYTASYLKLTVAEQEVIEIDQVNMIRKVGGVDQLDDQRRALGI